MSDRETRKRIFRKFRRESPDTIGVFWRYVQNVAQAHRMKDGLVAWDMVLSEVEEALDQPAPTETPYRASPFEHEITGLPFETAPQGAHSGVATCPHYEYHVMLRPGGPACSCGLRIEPQGAPQPDPRCPKCWSINPALCERFQCLPDPKFPSGVVK